MNKTCIIAGLIVILGLCNCSKNGSTAKKSYSGNPVVCGWYADPEAEIFDNAYWIFPTYSADYDNQVFFDAFSSSDLVHWENHIHIVDTSIIKWAHRALWAPAIIKKGSKYYLFFSANDIQRPGGIYWDKNDTKNHTGGIGIAVSDMPGGPYKDYLGKPLIDDFYNDAQPIDQFVFQDKDSTYYMIYGGWGHCNIAKLNRYFTGFVPWNDGSIFKEITPEGYVEGPLIFIRKHQYYFMWSEGNWGDSSYKVAYATADNITSKFIKIGTILQADTSVATGAGHNSVINIPGTDDWYIVYHRRPIPNEGRDHRVICIDRMEFNKDGTIQPVKMTFTGVKLRKLGK
jgi:beta-xylosidase